MIEKNPATPVATATAAAAAGTWSVRAKPADVILERSLSTT
jgi:hypothetical protein